MMKSTSRGPKNLFDLDDFSCKGSLVHSGGTEEFVQFSWSFELQEFELHELNCKSVWK